MPAVDVSLRMRAVRRRGTEAEQQLGLALRNHCLRFRTHVPLIGCSPDIVFGQERLVVFVDGDFWHGRIMLEGGLAELKASFRRPSRAFWVRKIMRNVDRDLRQVRLLRRHGWAVVRLWEKDVLKNPSAAAAIVCQRIRKRRSRSLKQRRDAA